MCRGPGSGHSRGRTTGGKSGLREGEADASQHCIARAKLSQSQDSENWPIDAFRDYRGRESRHRAMADFAAHAEPHLAAVVGSSDDCIGLLSARTDLGL